MKIKFTPEDWENFKFVIDNLISGDYEPAQSRWFKLVKEIDNKIENSKAIYKDYLISSEISSEIPREKENLYKLIEKQEEYIKFLHDEADKFSPFLCSRLSEKLRAEIKNLKEIVKLNENKKIYY